MELQWMIGFGKGLILWYAFSSGITMPGIWLTECGGEIDGSEKLKIEIRKNTILSLSQVIYIKLPPLFQECGLGD
jgi:hypothetical protein